MPFHAHDLICQSHHHDCNAEFGGEQLDVSTSIHSLHQQHVGRKFSDFLMLGPSKPHCLISPRTLTTQAASFLHVPAKKINLGNACNTPEWLPTDLTLQSTLKAPLFPQNIFCNGIQPHCYPGVGVRSTSTEFFAGHQKSLMELVQSTPPAVLVPLHAASIVVALPGHIAFELGEGCLFGFRKGVLLAFAGKSLGALASFGAGRSALGLCGIRDRLKKQMQMWPDAQAAAAGVERGGAFSVFLIRIAPVPCAIKNYALAVLTDIPWSVFIPATLLGLLPTTAAHVYAGTLAPSVIDLVSGHGVAMQAVKTAGVTTLVGFFSILMGYYLYNQIIMPQCEDLEYDDEDKSIQH